MKYSTPESALKDIWGHDSFRPAQADIIDAYRSGSDGLAIMATGGGKSVCFQIPGLMAEGTTVVISPLIALMQDQVSTLRKNGVEATCFYGDQPIEQVLEYNKTVKDGKAKFIYVSPEKLENEEFREDLKNIDIASFAIDEAHCASMWGHDFRPSYTRIGKYIDEIGAAQNKRIQRFGFTATADEKTRADVCNILGIEEGSFRYVGGFDRPNIEMDVRKVNNKYEEATNYALSYPGESMIIYSSTVKAAKELQDYMRRHGVEAGLYHGQLDYDVRVRTQKAFMEKEQPILVATSAFGMGVDMDDIKHVVHLHMPGSLEAYAQEMGRAGRNGEPARALMLASENDRNLQEYFIRSNHPEKEVIQAVQNVLSTFSQSEPLVVRDTRSQVAQKRIMALSPIEITPFELDSAIKILENHEALKTNREVNRNVTTVEFVDIAKDIDLNYLAEKRKHAATKLSAVEGFVNTRFCRRSFLLRSFGEKQKSHENCGGCDVCLYDAKQEQKFSNRLPNEVVDNAVKLIKSAEGKLTDNHVKKLLLGTSTRAYERKGWDQFEGFGSLKTWTSNDVDLLIRQMDADKLVNRNSGGRITLSESGVDWLNGSKKPMVASNGLKHRSAGHSSGGSVHEVESSPIEKEKRDFLEDWVAYKSKELGVTNFMVLSKDMIDKLSADNRPISNETLKEAGLSSSKLNLFGDELKKSMKGFSMKEADMKFPGGPGF